MTWSPGLLKYSHTGFQILPLLISKLWSFILWRDYIICHRLWKSVSGNGWYVWCWKMRWQSDELSYSTADIFSSWNIVPKMGMECFSSFKIVTQRREQMNIKKSIGVVYFVPYFSLRSQWHAWLSSFHNFITTQWGRPADENMTGIQDTKCQDM